MHAGVHKAVYPWDYITQNNALWGLPMPCIWSVFGVKQTPAFFLHLENHLQTHHGRYIPACLGCNLTAQAAPAQQRVVYFLCNQKQTASLWRLQGNVQCCVTGPAFEFLLQQPNAALVEAIMHNSMAFTRMLSHQKGQVMELLSSQGLHQNIHGQQRHIPVQQSHLLRDQC